MANHSILSSKSSISSNIFFIDSNSFETSGLNFSFELLEFPFGERCFFAFVIEGDFFSLFKGDSIDAEDGEAINRG